jgi:hypothetical protein
MFSVTRLSSCFWILASDERQFRFLLLTFARESGDRAGARVDAAPPWR